MARRATARAAGRLRAGKRCAGCAVAALVLSCAVGCATSDYERVRLGMSRNECYRALTHGAVWQTELGLCQQDAPGSGTSIELVVIVGRNQRVAGKFEVFTGDVSRVPAGMALLRGELSPALAGLTQVGPIDAARAVALDLSEYRGAQGIERIYARAAAGLVRIVASHAPANSPAPASDEVREALERLAAADAGRIDQVGDVYRYELRRAAAP